MANSVLLKLKRRKNCTVALAIALFLTSLLIISQSVTDTDSEGKDLELLLSRDLRVLNLDMRPQNTIPKRLHQTFKDYMIPVDYHPSMKSWAKNHPDWDFFFWTDETAAQLIREKYPQYYDLFLRYDHPLTRSDAIRYFILHYFGGVYADLDVTSIKPIEPFLRTNTCVLVPEPTVQTNLIFNLQQSLTNCIMATVAKHPFMDFLLASLPGSYRRIEHNHDVLHATGPFFLNNTYTSYRKRYPNCVSGMYCDVYISDHRHLVPRIDVPDLKHNVNEICVKEDIGALQRRACNRLTRTDFANPMPEDAYTDHLWLHLGWDHEKMSKVFSTKHILQIIPDVITYEMIRGSLE